jgi:hypothetical protein
MGRVRRFVYARRDWYGRRLGGGREKPGADRVVGCQNQGWYAVMRSQYFSCMLLLVYMLYGLSAYIYFWLDRLDTYITHYEFYENTRHRFDYR